MGGRTTQYPLSDQNKLAMKMVHGEPMLNATLNETNNLIWFVNSKYEYLDYNDAYAAIFRKYNEVDLRRGDSALDNIPYFHDKKIDFRKYYELGFLGTRSRMSLQFICKGIVTTLELEFLPIEFAIEGSKLVNIVMVHAYVQVHENRANENQVRVNPVNMASILCSIESCIFLVDEKHSLLYFNKAFKNFLEKEYGTKPEIHCLLFDQIGDDAFIDELKKSFKNALKGQEILFVFEHNNPVSELIAEYRILPVKNRDSIIGITVFSRDLTEIKKFERDRKVQNEELKTVNEQLDRFVYSASHDLRAPLMSIKGLINVIRSEPNPESQWTCLNYIDRSVNRLDKFISEIVNYSRNARTELSQELIDFENVLEESIDNLKYMEGAEEVKSLKKINAPHPFLSDRSRIIMIFNNIISNAVQYRDNRKVAFVRIAISTRPGKAIISFADNGIGIPSEHLAKIFNMFYRAHLNSRGSGMGLYNVKNAVEKLKGVIEVKSKIGIGTKFVITLPSLELNRG